MTDTPAEIEHLYRDMLMQRSETERLIMGSRMFDAARAMILASLPNDLSAAELRVALFERIYGNDFDEQTKQRIIDYLRQPLSPNP